ncbi:hypothetical protein BOX15_Mlig016503g1 [Macrostomum lignano]|uniref:Uncharacterized protein n=2 Tax=Macrostomum lignano TaxID=282301 RepID=A0A1I8GRP7_9PLAT|nr:hypothetical protein BOX15_Mlig016503g1 [Macrostomum lignano]
MAHTRRLALTAAASAILLIACCCTADAFIGIIGGKGRGACEKDGGICFTQDACCEDFTCEKASQATYGRCTSNKAQLGSEGGVGIGEIVGDLGGADGGSGGRGSSERVGCDSDADCPAGQCCSVEPSKSGYRGLGGRQACRPAGPSGCSGQSAENLFQQYYSGLFRKRHQP